jgi:blue copper oxidase
MCLNHSRPLVPRVRDEAFLAPYPLSLLMYSSRRQFITRSAFALLGSGIVRAHADHPTLGSGYPLVIPPDFSGGTLQAKPDTKEVWPGFPTPVLTLNGSIPGPTIRVRMGERFKARIQNGLAEPLVLHWHGILAPAGMDGNPRDAVPPGGSYEVDFPVQQPAGTYWYHAHTDQLTAKQVYLGLAGFFIVEDPAEASLGLPQDELDVPLLIQDRVSNPGHTLAYSPVMDHMVLGYLGDSTTVNGVPEASLQVKRSVYRLRLLNGSNARVFKIGLGDTAKFKLIANDAGLLPAPIEVTSLLLAPGNRAEILVDFSNFPHGSTVELKSLAFDGDMTMGSTQGQPRTLMRFIGQHTGSGGSVPKTLVPFIGHDHAQAKRTRQFVITMPGGGHGGHGGGMATDLINGLLYQMNRTDFTVPLGELEVWEFHNQADHMHPMHVHGAIFQVLSRSTTSMLPPEDRGWKDTILVYPGEVVRILIKFETYPGAFVLHCHNLEHEDGGMMLNFNVGSSPVEGPRLAIRREAEEIIVVAPHEATDYRLEGTPHLGHDSAWTPVTAVPSHTDVGVEFRLPRNGGAQYFRLVKQ